MQIEFKDTKGFTEDQLEDLFLSVQWSSGKYPDKLKMAMRNSDSVFSAWANSKLVGLINALSDGCMTVYFHYLLIHPEYQGRGIGKELVLKMLSKHENYARKVLIAYDKEIEFYRRCGFTVGEGKSPMFITHLTT